MSSERSRDDRSSELDRFTRWFDERTGLAGFVRGTLVKVYPDHWSFLLGEVVLFCFVVLIATGIFLTFFYSPSATPLVYDGSYAPLHGQQVSTAYGSVMRISFDVKAGLVFRQIHHWAANVMLGSLVLHVARVFFTGAFRRPREINWLLGVTLLLLALAAGVTGYSLPDDLLSGTGLRIIYSAALSIPLIGPWLAFLVFGGEFPTAEMIGRLFVFHIMLLPALMIAAITAHIGLVVLQKHSQYRAGWATETNVVGRRLWPGQAFRSTGLFFIVAAVLAALGGLVQVNPIWLYGPFIPYAVSSPAQPDWYLGWLEGALRLAPPFEPVLLGVTIPSVFIPGILIPGIVFTAFMLWPWIEARLTGDHRAHHLLDLPWDARLRFAVGMAMLTFFLVLTVAGGNDVIAAFLRVPVEAVTLTLRPLVIALPVLVAILSYALAREMRSRAFGREAPGPRVLVRTPEGGFREAGHGAADAEADRS